MMKNLKIQSRITTWHELNHGQHESLEQQCVPNTNQSCDHCEITKYPIKMMHLSFEKAKKRRLASVQFYTQEPATSFVHILLEAETQ